MRKQRLVSFLNSVFSGTLRFNLELPLTEVVRNRDPEEVKEPKDENWPEEKMTRLVHRFVEFEMQYVERWS
jgi:hypothetical protein